MKSFSLPAAQGSSLWVFAHSEVSLACSGITSGNLPLFTTGVDGVGVVVLELDTVSTGLELDTASTGLNVLCNTVLASCIVHFYFLHKYYHYYYFHHHQVFQRNIDSFYYIKI